MHQVTALCLFWLTRIFAFRLTANKMPGELYADPGPRFVTGADSTFDACLKLFGGRQQRLLDATYRGPAEDGEFRLLTLESTIISGQADIWHYLDSAITFLCVDIFLLANSFPMGVRDDFESDDDYNNNNPFGHRLPEAKTLAYYGIVCVPGMAPYLEISQHWFWRQRDIDLSPMYHDSSWTLIDNPNALALQGECVPYTRTVIEIVRDLIIACVTSATVLELSFDRPIVTPHTASRPWFPTLRFSLIRQGKGHRRGETYDIPVKAAWIEVSDFTTKTVLMRMNDATYAQTEVETGHQYQACAFVPQQRTADRMTLYISSRQLHPDPNTRGRTDYSYPFPNSAEKGHHH